MRQTTQHGCGKDRVTRMDQRLGPGNIAILFFILPLALFCFLLNFLLASMDESDTGVVMDVAVRASSEGDIAVVTLTDGDQLTTEAGEAVPAEGMSIEYKVLFYDESVMASWVEIDASASDAGEE